MTRRLLFLSAAVVLILVVPGLAFAQMSPAPLPPESFQRSIVFIDGTSLFYRFEALKLCVGSFYTLIEALLGGHRKARIMRIYWYTIKEKYDRTLKIHGPNSRDKVRVIFGTGVPTGEPDPKEKGVDALLVADLVYHAAQKNMDYAQLVAIDLDFVFAIRRVEDFGCRTAVIAIGDEAPEDLRKSCDNYRFFPKDALKYPFITPPT